jgi:hypothetical protein
MKDMKHSQHNFRENIEGAIKAGDHARVLNILMEEVGALMSTNKAALIKAVQDSGNKIANNISDKDLAKVVVSGITANNKKFLTNLVATLLKYQYSNDISGIGSALQGVGNIVGGISGAVRAGLTDKANVTVAQEGTHKADLELQAAKQNLYGKVLDAKAATDTARYGAAAVQEQSKSSSTSAVTIAIVFGTVVVFGILAYVMIKQNQANTAAATAGK